jgi:hypothetical protein
MTVGGFFLPVRFASSCWRLIFCLPCFGCKCPNATLVLHLVEVSQRRKLNSFFLFFELHRTSETLTNPIPRSIFEDCAGKSSILTKSPQAPRCRWERRLPIKAQTPLNPEKFTPTRSRTQDLRCYRDSYNH